MTEVLCPTPALDAARAVALSMGGEVTRDNDRRVWRLPASYYLKVSRNKEKWNREVNFYKTAKCQPPLNHDAWQNVHSSKSLHHPQ